MIEFSIVVAYMLVLFLLYGFMRILDFIWLKTKWNFWYIKPDNFFNNFLPYILSFVLILLIF